MAPPLRKKLRRAFLPGAITMLGRFAVKFGMLMYLQSNVTPESSRRR